MTRVRRRARRLHIVVTAGPTREYFDSVRYISNASSGKMGYAIAGVAHGAGHKVTLISGPTSLEALKRVRIRQVISAAEMLAATRAAFRKADAAVFSAAVSDYRPKAKSKGKAPKATRSRRVILEPTPDIAAELGRIKGRRVTVGFALEEGAGRGRAASKLRRKKFDAIVLNGPSNIGVDRARAEVLVKGGRWTSWSLQSKEAMARRIVRLVESLAQSSS